MLSLSLFRSNLDKKVFYSLVAAFLIEPSTARMISHGDGTGYDSRQDSGRTTDRGTTAACSGAARLAARGLLCVERGNSLSLGGRLCGAVIGAALFPVRADLVVVDVSLRASAVSKQWVSLFRSQSGRDEFRGL